MKNIFELILDFLFPLRCLGCQREGFWLCPSCVETLPLDPSYERFERILVFSVCDYEKNIIKKIIKICKFSGVRDLATILGHLVIRGAVHFPEIKDLLENNSSLIIIPIPLSPRRERERGFNQSLIIAQEISDYFKIPLLDKLKKSERKPQSGLSANKRAKNIEAAFFWAGGNLSNYRIILIDDVVTTGSTLSEAAKILKQSGAKRITGLTVAR
ncbi:MAG: ComF family protein [Patescibacteria group bacterium]